MCIRDRIIIIDQGKKVHDGSLEQIKDQYGYMHTLVVDVREPQKAQALDLHSRFNLSSEDLSKTLEGTTLSLRFNTHKIKAPDLLFHVMQNLSVVDMKVQETDIEEIVKGIYHGRGL